MLYKHLFSILCGHLNLNKKRKKIWIWPVTSQTGRYTGQTGRYTGRNRLNVGVWIQIWIPPVPTGNRPNQTGIPEPRPAVTGHRSRFKTLVQCQSPLIWRGNSQHFPLINNDGRCSVQQLLSLRGQSHVAHDASWTMASPNCKLPNTFVVVCKPTAGWRSAPA